MSHNDDVTDYFSEKASEYDLVDEQIYWVLSDELAKKILIDQIDLIKKNNINLLDAWAWTWRWALNFIELLSNKKISFKADLVDITEDMLDVAKEKIAKLWLDEKITCKVWNIEKLNEYKNNSYDFAISFYNVLSFVEDYSMAIKEISDKLLNWWKYIWIVGNKHHAYYFSLLTNRITELNNVNSNRIKFNDLMPSMHCFDAYELKKIFLSNWFKKVNIYWLLNYIYPWMEETFLKGQNEQKFNMLKNKSTFNKVLELEYKNCYNETLANRWNTLLFIAEK